LEPNERRKQYVYITGFNFLDGSRMQPHHFGKPFLGDSLKHPFAADIIAERLKLRRLSAFQWHALLRRL
jgi:hypothetical protein